MGDRFPRQVHHLIVKEFPVHEWVQRNWQPVDGDVRYAVAEVVFKADRPGDSVES